MSESAPVLVLIGPPGAGKSLVGKLLAKLLGVPFVDTDRRIVNKNGAISAIFAHQGEEGFRALERIEVSQALGEQAVIALGGGAVLDKQTQEDLLDARVVFLTVSEEAVARRIRGTTRPLLANGIDAWVALMNDRREIYERLATHTVDSSHHSAMSIAHQLADWIQQEEKA